MDKTIFEKLQEPEKKQASSILIKKGTGEEKIIANADERRNRSQVENLKEAGNSGKPPAGKNAVSPPDTNDPRVELRRLKFFLENNGFPMHSLLKDTKRKTLGSSERNGAFFYIAQAGNNFTFHWESHYHDEKWFNDRKTAISNPDLFPGSYVDTERRKCRLWIPVDQDRYCESILDIVIKTKSIMEYIL